MRRIFFWPLYPFIVASLPAVHFYLGNFRVLEPGDPLRLLILYFALTGGLLAAAGIFRQGVHRSALVLTPLLLILFKGSSLGEIACLVLLVLSLVLAGILRRRPFSAVGLTLPLNMAALVFVALPMARVTYAELRENTPVSTPLYQASLSLTFQPGSPPPDIYFLVMDGLGQPEFLERDYGISPGILRTGLENRGFKVLGRSRCAYPQTALSVASTLNLGFVQDLLDIPDPDNMDRRVLGRITGKSRAVQALQQVGYQVATFPSGYPVTRLHHPDLRREPAINPSFLEYYVLDDGLLPLVQKWMGRGEADLSYAMRRNRLNFIFDQLPRVREGFDEDTPVFVFAHVLAPHPPFVFDETGTALDSNSKFGYADGSHWLAVHDSGADAYRTGYSAQLTHVMDRLERTVEAILANSPRPPVIIIQGDHGPGSGVQWEDFEATDHAERAGIFNAWYLPPGLEMELTEDESSVNTFILLFNEVFAAQLEPLPKKHWFAPMSLPYAFSEVAE